MIDLPQHTQRCQLTPRTWILVLIIKAVPHSFIQFNTISTACHFRPISWRQLWQMPLLAKATSPFRIYFSRTFSDAYLLAPSFDNRDIDASISKGLEELSTNRIHHKDHRVKCTPTKRFQWFPRARKVWSIRNMSKPPSAPTIKNCTEISNDYPSTKEQHSEQHFDFHIDDKKLTVKNRSAAYSFDSVWGLCQ